MSSALSDESKRVTIPDVLARKGGEPLVCLTAYTAPMTALLDTHTDILLVGDSLGMVLYGMETTVGVELETMIRHGKAVVNASKSSMIVVDMPFGSYEESPEQAFRNAARVLKETGCQAVKLEGGVDMAPTIEFLVKRGIPVMAHIGLTPQSVNTIGGFKAQGREEKDWARLINDAKAVEAAGAFATVLEAMAAPLAGKITAEVSNITIGIGASAACDGQIVVSEDMLGFQAWAPRFVRRYSDVATVIGEAARSYAEDVRARSFPAAENTFSMKKKS